MTTNTPSQSPPKSWIFVSHSNKDIDAVRSVRDELERNGHNPLLFFLKCINDHDELDDLITREIEARNFFLFCDSPNAQKSDWVQRELAFIRGLPNRVCHVVNLQADSLTQVRSIKELSRRATVFLSFARADWSLIKPISDALVAAEYRVWSDMDSLQTGDGVGERIIAAITEVIDHGFVLLFITPSFLTSHWCRFESCSALEIVATHPRGSVTIVPVVLAPRDAVLTEIPAHLRSLQFLELGDCAPAEAGRRIVAHLRRQ
jgi:hypothetical protein